MKKILIGFATLLIIVATTPLMAYAQHEEQAERLAWFAGDWTFNEVEGGNECGLLGDFIVHCEGAWKNGERIRVSTERTLERALLGTGFAYDVHRAERDNLDLFRRFIKRAQAVRRAGSAALDLAYVACGRFDGFWELSLHPWDVSAGFLLVDEAGGRTSDLQGGPATPQGCVATNGPLHEAMLEILREGAEAAE